jgi:diguanylate cyclase (GGDEF)-like protein/PAS domain S-box-containing protein
MTRDHRRRTPEEYGLVGAAEDTTQPGISVSEALAAASAAHRDTTRLIRMLTVLGQAGDVADILQRTLFSLSELFDVDAVVALVPAGRGQMRLVAECGLGEDLADQVPLWAVGPDLALTMQTLAPTRVPAGEPSLPAALDELGLTEVLWLPGGDFDELVVLGLLQCSSVLDDSSVEMLRSVGNRLGVALDNARHAQRIERLGRLGRTISTHLDPDEVLQRALAELPDIFAADATTVALLQDDGDVLFWEHSGVEDCRGMRQSAESLVAWPEVSAGRSFVSGPQDPRILADWPDYTNYTSVLAVPLPAQDRLVGVLYLIRRNGQPFSVAARDALMLFSAQLGAAVDNASLYVALRDSQEELQLIANSISDLVSVLAADGRCLYASPSHASQLGLDPADAIGRLLADMVHPDDRDRLLAELAAAGNGLASARAIEYRGVVGEKTVWLETVMTRLQDGRAGGREPDEIRLVLSSRVISDRKQLEERLRHAATTDELTGLPNRRHLLQLLGEAVTRETSDRTALLFLDLDRFKSVNDTLGHAAGDRLLVEVAHRLERCLAAGRSSDVLARLGGDEFVLLLRGLDPLTAAATAERQAERILEALAAPLRMRERDFDISASIGIVLPDPAPGEDPSAAAHEVLRAADTAMYQAKSGGRARSATFDADLDRTMRDRLDLAADLRRAAERGELRLHYQPVVDAQGALRGVEALLRWRHPSRGDVPPLDVIPLAEEMGIINGIGRWVLSTACRQAAQWNAERAEHGLAPISMAVNLSPSQIEDGLVGAVTAELTDSGLAPDQLTLEVTETAYMQPDSVAPQVLARLRQLGVGVAIDDFGTGFSSFDRLRRFPADVLKIDRSFVRALEDGPAAGAIVQAMIDLARALGSEVVAEGVERADQAVALVGAGCSRLQGWLFAPARPAEDLALAIAAAEPVFESSLGSPTPRWVDARAVPVARRGADTGSRVPPVG